MSLYTDEDPSRTININLKGHENLLKACAIQKQVERIGSITAKLMGITHYECKDYFEGKIVDIDKASRPRC